VIFPIFDRYVIPKMSNIEDDMDPIQAMHTGGNDALFAIAKLGFGVEAHMEGTEADTAAKNDLPP
jgi:hypothetical protein